MSSQLHVVVVLTLRKQTLLLKAEDADLGPKVGLDAVEKRKIFCLC
jgi:hypothetical protein